MHSLSFLRSLKRSGGARGSSHDYNNGTYEYLLKAQSTMFLYRVFVCFVCAQIRLCPPLLRWLVGRNFPIRLPDKYTISCSCQCLHAAERC